MKTVRKLQAFKNNQKFSKHVLAEVAIYIGS